MQSSSLSFWFYPFALPFAFISISISTSPKSKGHGTNKGSSSKFVHVDFYTNATGIYKFVFVEGSWHYLNFQVHSFLCKCTYICVGSNIPKYTSSMTMGPYFSLLLGYLIPPLVGPAETSEE